MTEVTCLSLLKVLNSYKITRISDSSEERDQSSIFIDQPTEKVEEVLNSGMKFIGGMLEKATGKKGDRSSLIYFLRFAHI